jgi:hypothetical protein
MIGPGYEWAILTTTPLKTTKSSMIGESGLGRLHS